MHDPLILVESVLQSLVTSLQIGAVYGLLCVGLGLIFSIMRVINFAQGEFMMLGMYAALFAFSALGLGQTLGTWAGLTLGALLAGVTLFVLAAVLHPALLARVTHRSLAELALHEGDPAWVQVKSVALAR